MDSILKKILNFFFPQRCALCRKIIPQGQLLCAQCGKADRPDDLVFYLNLRKKQKSIMCFSPYLYEDKIKTAILRMKFNNCPDIAGFLAAKLYDTSAKADICDFDIVTSVPLSKRSEKERGYNQAEIIAREFSKLCNKPYRETLRKIVNNKEQHKLKLSERRKNVIGVYECLDNSMISGKKILLIDDIITSGNTVSECVSVLTKGGAKDVICASAAKVR